MTDGDKGFNPGADFDRDWYTEKAKAVGAADNLKVESGVTMHNFAEWF